MEGLWIIILELAGQLCNTVKRASMQPLRLNFHTPFTVPKTGENLS